MISHVIFDLDGTLIDSSNSILAAFKGAFEAVGQEPVRSLTSDIIGPPLKEALVSLSASNDPLLLNELTEAFKACYDTTGYRQTVVFSGILEMLADLAKKGLPLYIATNKRIKPTALILEHLGWTRYFSGIFALDSLTPYASHKAELLTHIVSAHSLIHENTLYVGDRIEDERAANLANVHFAYASWGYGVDRDTDRCHETCSLEKPLYLTKHVENSLMKAGVG